MDKKPLPKPKRGFLKKWKAEGIALHGIWFDFEKKFYPKEKVLLPKKKWQKIGKITIKHAWKPAVWKWKGHELMKRVAKWAEKHPSVMIARCDDNDYCGSDLVFIPSHDKRGNGSWHGVTVVFIPGCSGDLPGIMFFYPNHVDGVLKTFQNYKKIERAVTNNNRKAKT